MLHIIVAKLTAFLVVTYYRSTAVVHSLILTLILFITSKISVQTRITFGIHLLQCIELNLIGMDSNTSDHNSGIQLLENLLQKNDVKGAIEFAKKVQTSSRKLKRLSHFIA